MSDNRISSIQNDDFPQNLLNTIKSMDFSYNPFSCSCILYWFRFWAENNKDKLSGYPALYQCYSPLELSGRSISNYNPSYFTCHKLEEYQIILISSGSVLFAAIFVVCIVSKYKWHMRYYIYLLRSRRRENTSRVTSDYLYDAFVAYSAEDRSWVISNLMAKLEGEENFRLCLHERDFLPGRTIIDQISETIKHSRKVVLVLSNSFAKSQWCQYEVLMAQHRLIEDGGNALVLIMLDEIKSKYRTDCLSLILRTMTYIEWTNCYEERKLFWRKLILSLKSQ